MMTISMEKNLMVKRATGDHFTNANKQHWSIGVGLFFTGGIGALILGLILAAESYLGLVIESERVANLSAFLLIASFPLLSLGAHCMDKISAIEREEREANSTEDK